LSRSPYGEGGNEAIAPRQPEAKIKERISVTSAERKRGALGQIQSDQ